MAGENPSANIRSTVSLESPDTVGATVNNTRRPTNRETAVEKPSNSLEDMPPDDLPLESFARSVHGLQSSSLSSHLSKGASLNNQLRGAESVVHGLTNGGGAGDDLLFNLHAPNAARSANSIDILHTSNATAYYERAAHHTAANANALQDNMTMNDSHSMTALQGRNTDSWKAKFDRHLQREFLSYQYPIYTKQWKTLAFFAAILSIFFGIYGAFTVQDTQSRTGILALCGAMFLASVGHILFTRTKYHRQYAFTAYLSMLLIYGLCLSAIELFIKTENPAGYLYCFLILMYTTICQDYRYIAMIGAIVVTSDVICLSQSQNNVPLEVVLTTALYYAVANFIGTAYAYSYDMDTRKHFYNLFNLWEEKKYLTEAGEKAEAIALSIIPKGVWYDFRKGEKVDLNGILGNPLYSYQDVTILFGDIVGFTTLSGAVSADTLVKLLNSIFFEYDKVVELYGLEKIKTLGDCYMLCAGLPEPVPFHALRTVCVGTKMIRIVSALTALQPVALQLRVGVHTGNVVAGILGEEKIIFDVWSTDVSIASLMEQSGRPSSVHVSDKTRQQIEGYVILRPGPPVTYQGNEIQTYFVNELDDKGRLLLDSFVNGKLAATTPGAVVMNGNTVGGAGVVDAPNNASIEASEEDRDESSAAANAAPNNATSNGNPTGATRRASFVSPLGLFSSRGGNSQLSTNGNTTAAPRRMSVARAAMRVFQTPNDDGNGNNAAAMAAAAAAAKQQRTKHRMAVFKTPEKESSKPPGELENTAFIEGIEPIRKSLWINIRGFRLTFKDDETEDEYQVHQTSKSHGRLMVGIMFTILTNIVSLVKNIILENTSTWTWQANGAVLVLQLLFLAFVRIQIGLRYRPKAINNITRVNEASEKKASWKSYFSAENWHQSPFYESIVAFFKTNVFVDTYQHIAFPAVILAVMMAVIVAQILLLNLKPWTSHDMYVLLMVCCIFNRLRWIYMSYTSVALHLLFHIVYEIHDSALDPPVDPNNPPIDLSPDVTAALNAKQFYATTKYATLAFMSMMVVVIVIINRRIDFNVRVNYLLKKDLGRRKFEVDDVRIKAEKLLYKLLPKHVVVRLKRNPDREISDFIESAGIMFAAICNFKETDMRSITILNDIIVKFDQMLGVYDVEKIKTVGSSATYMVACGLIDFQMKQRGAITGATTAAASSNAPAGAGRDTMRASDASKRGLVSAAGSTGKRRSEDTTEATEPSDFVKHTGYMQAVHEEDSTDEENGADELDVPVEDKRRRSVNVGAAAASGVTRNIDYRRQDDDDFGASSGHFVVDEDAVQDGQTVNEFGDPISADPLNQDQYIENDDDVPVVHFKYNQHDVAKRDIYKRFLDYALALKARMVDINRGYGTAYRMRIGIHIGPLVAGVIGKTKFAYDVWGDTVNVASRMESSADPDQIQVTEKTFLLLKDDFEFQSIGTRVIKGKGRMTTFLLIGRRRDHTGA